MFAALSIEHDPVRLSDLPTGLIIWIQDAGGIAAFALVLWWLLGLPGWKTKDRDAIPAWQRSFFLFGTLFALVCLTAGSGLSLVPPENQEPLKAGSIPPRLVGQWDRFLGPAGWKALTATEWANLFLTAGGLAAILVVTLPFWQNVWSMSFRRIYALAKLSFKEALRRRVLYAFSALLLVFLFGSWFISTKPEDEVRTYVRVVTFAMSSLLFLTAVLLSAFSIPTDIKQQTIHTIVTKPVERFEIALGRFLGYLALMTLVLAAMTGLSLLYVLRGVNPRAAAASLMARDPLYGDELRFENTENERAGVNVGREWEYRSYITAPAPGKEKEPPTARWDFMTVPASLGTMKQVRGEYTFDVYRTTKGQEGADVACDFRFYTAKYEPGNDDLYQKELRSGTDDNSDELAERYGYYEIPAQPVTDYQTQSFTVPGGLFRNAASGEATGPGGRRVPRLSVRVNCSKGNTQYVGMAKYDLYFRLDVTDAATSGASKGQFALNFSKASFGLWLQMALLIGLAVALSTYLNGVISALVTICLYFGGLGRSFIAAVGLGQNEGGGPLEAIRNIANRQLASAGTSESMAPADRAITLGDEGFRWLVRRILSIIPDVWQMDFSQVVGEGFNVPGVQLLLSFLLLLGYLLPWAVLAFYLLRWREVASST